MLSKRRESDWQVRLFAEIAFEPVRLKLKSLDKSKGCERVKEKKESSFLLEETWSGKESPALEDLYKWKKKL